MARIREPNSAFGNTLKLLRSKKSLPQNEVAEALGIAPQVLANYEKGIREPNIGKLNQIANYYNVSVDYLTGNTAIEAKNINEIIDNCNGDQKNITSSIYDSFIKALKSFTISPYEDIEFREISLKPLDEFFNFVKKLLNQQSKVSALRIKKRLISEQIQKEQISKELDTLSDELYELKQAISQKVYQLTKDLDAQYQDYIYTNGEGHRMHGKTLTCNVEVSPTVSYSSKKEDSKDGNI